MKSDKFFRENTTLSKLALYALGGAAAIWAVKKLKEAAVKKEKQENLDSLVTKAATETGLSATITAKQAKVIADQLYNAMERTGTDENAIINALNPLNAVDLAMVNAAFGYRNYGTFGSPMFGEGTPLSLMSWLQKELSGRNLEYVQERYREAGISGCRGCRGIGKLTYTFKMFDTKEEADFFAWQVMKTYPNRKKHLPVVAPWRGEAERKWICFYYE